ncbi:MAG: enediyne biosynthesis protein [Actinobacteria bacterium 13_2_20CM_2_71_6]|nr:MAG: enediyne biosynthesis protein [Actinobacteria bacterium 13_2_20CM_2_71_6]
MSTTLGSLRRLVLTPALSEVSFARRGFPGASSPAASHLEAVPQSVICGFEWGIDVRSLAELECRLGLVQPQLRGFAYEGATMAYTILDAMRPRRGHRTEELLRGPGQPHLFLAYIGIGFAMSHLPRFLWNGVVPDLSGSPYHPTMSWLAVDGYGFDRAYFDTARVVDGQVRPAAYPWDGSAGYFPRAIDQGIGRALWFIHGARVPDVAAAVGRFAVQRRSDLWSGVGLAATFAGGCPAADLGTLRRLAVEQDPGHEAHLAQGAVFAAKARMFAGFVPTHSEAAVQALADLSVPVAADLADAAAAVDEGSARTPRYEHWRRTIRERLGVATPAR